MAQDARRSNNPSLAQLLTELRTKAHSLESSSGMRSSFRTLLTAHHLSQDSIRYSGINFAEGAKRAEIIFSGG